MLRELTTTGAEKTAQAAGDNQLRREL